MEMQPQIIFGGHLQQLIDSTIDLVKHKRIQI